MIERQPDQESRKDKEWVAHLDRFKRIYEQTTELWDVAEISRAAAPVAIAKIKAVLHDPTVVQFDARLMMLIEGVHGVLPLHIGTYAVDTSLALAASQPQLEKGYQGRSPDVTDWLR